MTDPAETALERAARAGDAEDSASRGEPSPWREDICGDDEEWKHERCLVYSAAITAFLSMSDAEVERLARALYIATSTAADPAGRFDRAIEWALDEDSGELPGWIADLKTEVRALLSELSKMGGATDND